MLHMGAIALPVRHDRVRMARRIPQTARTARHPDAGPAQPRAGSAGMPVMTPLSNGSSRGSGDTLVLAWRRSCSRR